VKPLFKKNRTEESSSPCGHQGRGRESGSSRKKISERAAKGDVPSLKTGRSANRRKGPAPRKADDGLGYQEKVGRSDLREKREGKTRADWEEKTASQSHLAAHVSHEKSVNGLSAREEKGRRRWKKTTSTRRKESDLRIATTASKGEETAAPIRCWEKQNS